MSTPTSQPKPQLRIPPIVKALGWVSFFTDSASEMIYPLLPALLRSIGASPVWLGAMEGIAEALSALMKWQIGPLVDRTPKKKPLIVVGYALATFSRPLIAFATAGWHIVFLRSLDRIGKGIRSVPRDAMIAESVDPVSLATAFSFHRMMDNTGSVLGPLIAFALLRGLELDVKTVIGLAIVPGLVALLTLGLGVREEAPSSSSSSSSSSSGASSSEPSSEHAHESEATATARARSTTHLPGSVVRYLIALGVFTLGSSADSFLLLRAVDVGLDAAWIPLLWLALSASKAGSNLLGGWLGDRFGRQRTLVLAWIFYACVYAAAPHVANPLAFAGLVVVYGAYYGLAEGNERAILAALAPHAMRGRAFGAMHAITGLAVLPANLVFGVLYTHSPKLAFGAGAACALLGAVLMMTLARVRPSVERAAAD